MSDLLIAPCSQRAALYAVTHWHYSGRLSAPPLVRYGVWEAGVFVGAVIFGRGATSDLLRPYGLDTTEGAELTRVALREHDHPVSTIVARAIALLQLNSPGLRLLVSFADPARGHVGTIYQAMNWIYTGTTAPTTNFRTPEGAILHGRVVSPTGYKMQYGRLKRVPRSGDLERVRMPGKHRYLFPLTRQMRRKVEALRLPYPKLSADKGSTVSRLGSTEESRVRAPVSALGVMADG